MSKWKDGKIIPYSLWSEEDKAIHRKRVLVQGNIRKAKLVEMAGGKCITCGYNKSLRSLTFHHQTGKKLFGLTVANIKSRTWEDVLTEYHKCVLLCSNCHGEIEDKIQEERVRGRQVMQPAFNRYNVGSIPTEPTV